MIKIKEKKKKKRIILFLEVVILCGLVLMLSYCVKYQKAKEEKERERQKVVEAALEWEKENEENYKKLEEIFLQNEEEFNIIVENLKKQKLMDQVTTLFFYLGEEKWNGSKEESEEVIYFYNGELLEDLEYCSQDTYDKIKKNEELYEILKEISKKKIIIEIVWMEEMNEIEFAINPNMTPFITNNNGVPNLFTYSEADDCEKYGYKQIKDNWYMWISPRPE